MDPILGQIILWAGNFIPSGWLLCDGSSLQITSNQALYSLLGVTYGGNGSTTFNLPDLRSAVPMGADIRVPNQMGLNGKKTGAATATGTTTGTGSITIGVNNLPAHTHTATFTPGSGGTGTASVDVQIPAIDAGGTGTNSPVDAILGPPSNNAKPYNTASANTFLKTFTATGTATVPPGTGTVAVADTGNGAALPVSVSGSASVSTIQPSLYLSYIIAIEGIYPNRP
jgi:microcystin-dependent protein